MHRLGRIAASTCCRAYWNKNGLSQWDFMKKVRDVLVPFEELTRQVSREDATAADVIPAITGIVLILSYIY